MSKKFRLEKTTKGKIETVKVFMVETSEQEVELKKKSKPSKKSSN
jgi:hypothetical protein